VSSRRRRSRPGALRAAAGLGWADWTVVLGAALLLPTAAVASRCLNLARLLRVARALGRRRGPPRGGPDAERILRLVHAVAGRCRPAPACLARALVALVLLRRRALPARLILGVSTAGGALEGHAWVDCGVTTVPAAGAYAPILVVDDRGAVPAGSAA